MNILYEFPKSMSHYEDYRQRVERGDLVAAGASCRYCHNPGHFIGDCPHTRHRHTVNSRKTIRVQGQSKSLASFILSVASGTGFFSNKKQSGNVEPARESESKE